MSVVLTWFSWQHFIVLFYNMILSTPVIPQVLFLSLGTAVWQFCYQCGWMLAQRPVCVESMSSPMWPSVLGKQYHPSNRRMAMLPPELPASDGSVAASPSFYSAVVPDSPTIMC